MGCEVKGVDLGSEYIEYGNSKGIDLIKIKFDRISYLHVIERIADLELIKIKERLNEKGVLYIEVPGILNSVKSR